MKKTNLMYGLTCVFAFLFAVTLFLTLLCFEWTGAVNLALGISPPTVTGDSSTVYFNSDYGLNDNGIEAMLAASDEHDVATMTEGAVLLKNDGALPLTADERDVTLFGRAVADPFYRGNSGGPSLDAKRLVTLYDALQKESFRINDTLYNAYTASQTKRLKGNGNWSIGEEPQSFYTAPLHESYAAAFNDAAIVMFARDGGEGNDLPLSDNDGVRHLALHDKEAQLLRMIETSGKFSKTIVLINSPYAMELEWLYDTQYGVDAALWIGGPGLKGFTGVADLLTGKADPSGRLVDTYAADSRSSAAMQNYGNFTYGNTALITQGHSDKYIIEVEGIYGGYKYYETRYADQILGLHNAAGPAGIYASIGNSWNYAAEVTYPFGYGLSYARFTQTLRSVEWDRTAHTVTAVVNVRNDGDPYGTYNGKSRSAVQLYAQLPYTESMAEKPAVQLIGFEKSPLLAVGADADVTVTADDYLFATYDENAVNGADSTVKGCYVFYAGDHFFAVGADVHDALNNILAAREGAAVEGRLTDVFGGAASGDSALAKKLSQSAADNTTYARSRETNAIVSNKLRHVDINTYGEYVTYLTRRDWNTFPKPCKDLTASPEMVRLLNGVKYVKPADAAVYDSSRLGIDAGINFVEMRAVAYGDAKWDDFLRQLSLSELCAVIGENLGNPAVSAVNKPANANTDGPAGAQGSYKYGDKNPATQHVNEIVAAATWNKQILRDRGKFIGEDCLFTNTAQLWSPGANLHRTPYSGRNYEYYSEDSVMSYLCAAEQVAQMQAKGVNVTIKHFCGNDQEVNREGVAVFMTEQAFRQGPLKGFEGAFTVGGATGTMMAMNRIGCIPFYEDEATVTGVLRGEWGFEGVTVTDAARIKYYGTVECLAAGTDLFCMDNSRGAEIQSYIVTNKDGYVLQKLLEANKHYYYAMSRSNLINGLTADTEIRDFIPWWQPVTIVFVVALGVAAIGCAAVYAVRRLRQQQWEAEN